MNIITEGKTQVFVEPQKIVSKKMPVFYNPVMIVNRDFSLLFLNSLEKKDLIIADPLAGSGIRSFRMLKELKCVKQILVNDTKKDFKEQIKKNLELNNLKSDKIIIKNEDANKALLSNAFFDYIDVDPFGTPNPFLDTSIRSLRRKSYLSVTATDTSALCGSYSLACKRKYWADPLRNELMHEFAVRILIRKIQLLGAHQEKALIPLVSFATDHYVKIFFESINNKTKVDEVLKQHSFFECKGQKKGPIWTGKINDNKLLKKMLEKSENLNISKKTDKLLRTLVEESEIDSLFFFDIHELASEHKLKSIPRTSDVMCELEKKGFKASRTHFSDTAIKTDADIKEIIKIIKNN